LSINSAIYYGHKKTRSAYAKSGHWYLALFSQYLYSALQAEIKSALGFQYMLPLADQLVFVINTEQIRS
jgi:hypothetical protein